MQALNFLCIKALVLFLLSCTRISASSSNDLSVFETIAKYPGDATNSFILGNYGYFLVTENENCTRVSAVYKYNDVLTQFDKILTFPYHHIIVDLYPFYVDNQVLCFVFF